MPTKQYEETIHGGNENKMVDRSLKLEVFVYFKTVKVMFGS